MTDYDNNNSGALFKNDKKETDKHPDYRGSCEINHVPMWVSSWIKTSKAGSKYMSLSFTPKNAQDQGKSLPSRVVTPPDEFDDDNIPF